MVPRDMVNAPAERLHVQGSVVNKKCETKVPNKIHKSEREKRKRGTQNDLFNELGAMLEPDRQNNGKACVLGDTTRILKDLVSQVESLRKENSTLKNESHYVVLERNELRDDNSMLRNEILELQNKLRMRLQSNPIWSQDTTTRSAVAVPYPTSGVFPVQHSPHSPVITSTALSLHPVITEQCYAAPPRELQLFPEASSASTEDSELSQDQGISNSVTRPQARYPTPAVMSPVNEFPILPRMGEEQQYSSGTSEEDGPHRV